LLLHALVHSADIQDRDGGGAGDRHTVWPASIPAEAPCRRRLSGPLIQSAVCKVLQQIDVEIVKRSDTAKGFAALPERWIVERAIARLNRCGRSAKCLNRRALAF
jgi:transposase